LEQATTTNEDRLRAGQEALFCQSILAKAGDSVVKATLPEGGPVAAWAHFPPGDVFDAASGAQWYYHCHMPPEPDEHGHFHCFVRPNGKEGPVHHLVAVGVDAFGQLKRLFTVNHWVVGDDWLDAEPTIELLSRFDMQMPRPSYLVNRWLTAILRLYGDDIAELIRERDRVLAAHVPQTDVAAREDKQLEVTSQVYVDLSATTKALGGEAGSPA
jgi:hypothetical protein